MVCSKCGAELKDGAKFCVNCGTPVEETPVNEAPVGAAPVQEAASAQEAAPQKAAEPVDVKKTVNEAADKLTAAVNKATKQNFKKPVVLGVAAAAVVLVLVIIIGIIAGVAGNAYKKPINNLAKGINKQNGKTIASAFAPTKLWDEDDFEDYEDTYEKMDKVKIEIYDKHSVSRSERSDYADSSILEKIADDDIKFSDVYKVTVHISYEYNGDERCGATELVVGKYKGKWYLVSGF